MHILYTLYTCTYRIISQYAAIVMILCSGMAVLTETQGFHFAVKCLSLAMEFFLSGNKLRETQPHDQSVPLINDGGCE